MNGELKQVINAVFECPSLKDIKVHELRQLVSLHPYSTLFHLLYSKKLKQESNIGYADSATRTALYFSNPHWLNYQLTLKEENDEAVIEEPQKEITEQVFVEEMATAEETLAGGQHEYRTEYTVSESFIETAETNGIEQNGKETSGYETAEMIRGNEEHVAEEPVTREPDNAAIVANEYTEPATFSEAIADAPEIKQTVELKEETATIQEHVTESLPELNKEQIAEPVGVTELLKEATEGVTQDRQESQTEAAVDEIKSPVTEQPVLFEPLYTIDYFASQGIKLSAEEESKDELGKKMRSFTEWLKSMKKIHPEKFQQLNAGEEKNIQTAAEHSNDEALIATETMAEVLLKQGRADKAVEVYEKLSLLNPAKSAYFAAKIEELKTR
ncbi:MAG: hypothetical protein SFU87_17815 [Chitinophagaceae bacterium]|nr:hypothetical protein [Chitinophagaceae bacterium]